MLFAEGPDYYNEKHRSLLKKMERFYTDAYGINQYFWAEASIDTRYEAGDQTVYGQIYNNIPVDRRTPFSFNRIRPIVNMISGYQRRNRKSTIVVPRENGDQAVADQFTKVLMWQAQQEGTLETISHAFYGALVTGMNLLRVWIDYRSDPISGDIKIENCSYNSFLIDPYFRKPDLSDCNGLWRRVYLTPEECVSLLPNKAQEIGSLAGVGDFKDGKFLYMPENYSLDKQRLLAFDEYYYRSYRKQTLLIDVNTNERIEWRKDKKLLRDFLQQFPQIVVKETKVPTVRLAIVVQGHVLYNGPQPLDIDMYPFVPVFAYYNPQLQDMALRIQGVVRGLRDAQYLYNRRKNIELDILESQINSGWIYKENALLNPKDVFQSGQGRGIGLKREAQMTDIQQIQAPQVPPSMIELSRSLGEELNRISGVSEELLGSAVDDKAGILSMLRQGAGLTTLQTLFDQLDYSQKLLGRLLITTIQQNFTPGKIRNIIEAEPDAQFYNKNFGIYDAVVEEGINTSTQRQMQFAQLLHLREVGVPVPDDSLIAAATLQDKQELINKIEAQRAAQQQQQQALSQAQMQEVIARSHLAEARAAADEGLAVERTSRVAENESLAIERRAEAQKDRMSGVLDMVKALKELEAIDLTQLQTLISLVETIKQAERSDVSENKPSPSVTSEQPVSLGAARAAPIEEPTPEQGISIGT